MSGLSRVPWRRWLSKWVTAFSLVHLLVLGGFLARRAWSPELSPFLALINTVLPYLFAPLLLTLPLSWLTRSRVARLATLATLALFLSLYGTFFAPRVLQRAGRPADNLIVMTFNLGYGRAPAEEVVRAIRQEEADLVTLQEMTPWVARQLQWELSEAYPYMELASGGGLGLLSRYPILDSRRVRLTGMNRPVLQARLRLPGATRVPETPQAPVRGRGKPAKTPGEEFHVLVTHPQSPGLSWLGDWPLPTGLYDGWQERQMADLAWRASILEGPVLVMGDFNMTDQTQGYARMTAVLKDAYREAGWGFGFTFPHGLRLGRWPVPGPLVRIDYVFHSPGWHAEWARVGCGSGSDHCYVVVGMGDW